MSPTASIAAPRDSAAEHMLAWLMGLTVVGFPLVSMVATIVGIETRDASLVFRAFVDLLAVVFVLVLIARRDRMVLDPLVLLLLYVYLIRLVWDTQRVLFDDVIEDLLFYVFTGLIPAIAAGLGSSYWRDALVARVVFMVASTGALVTIAAYFLGVSDVVMVYGRLWSPSVNPITFGQMGATILLATFVLWRRSPLPGRLVMVVACGAGLWLMVVSASRSPFLSLGLGGLAYLISQRRWRLTMLLGGLGLIAYFGGDIIERLQGSRLVSVGDRSVLERFVLQHNAWADFLRNPLLGSGYRDSMMQGYPHNIIIESAMALGLGGLLLTVAVCVFGILRSLRGLAAGDHMLGLLFWQTLVLMMFSGSLFGGGALFMLLMVLGVRYGKSRSASVLVGPPPNTHAPGWSDRETATTKGERR